MKNAKIIITKKILCRQIVDIIINRRKKYMHKAMPFYTGIFMTHFMIENLKIGFLMYVPKNPLVNRA